MIALFTDYLGEFMALGSAMGWATAVILFRVAGRRVQPLSLNLFKNSVALLLLVPTMLLAGQSLWPQEATSRTALLILISGFLGMGVSDTFFLMSLNRLGASLQAIVNTLYAPLVVVFSALLLHEHLSLWQYFGVVLVLLALLLVSREGARSREIDTKTFLAGVLFAFCAISSMATSVLMIKPVLAEVPVAWSTLLRLLGGMVFLLPALALKRRGWHDALVAWRWENLRILGPAAFIGTYITLFLLVGSLKYTLASISTVLNQTSNLFIFLLAVLFLREPTSPRKWLGIVFGVIGAMLVMFAGRW